MAVMREVNKRVPIGLGLRLLSVWQAVYEASDGLVGERLGNVRMLLLRTTGRRSGRTRTAALLYIADGDNYVVVGSKGGSAQPPAWFLNLDANPDVGVQVGRRHFRARARVATGAERKRLWAAVNRVWAYDAYQSRTSREIPIVVLEPTR